MSDSEDIKDLQKAVNAVHARISKGNEYILREIRLIADDNDLKYGKIQEGNELRIRSLEDSRIAAKWIIKTISKIAVAVPIAGGIFIKTWKVLQEYKILP